MRGRGSLRSGPIAPGLLRRLDVVVAEDNVIPTIQSLQLDTLGWIDRGETEPNAARVWETPQGDAVVLYFCDGPPTIPACATVEALCAFYREAIARAGAELVECRVEAVARPPARAVLVLMKAPQEPSGRLYQGSYTIPFRDFSFVVKVQCAEQGMTGVREAILFDQRRRAGEQPRLDGAGPPFPGWNPDAAEHDAMFPTHPVSRARRLLEHVRRTTTLADALARLPGFALPS